MSEKDPAIRLNAVEALGLKDVEKKKLCNWKIIKRQRRWGKI